MKSGPAFPNAQRLWDSDSQSWAVHSVGGMTLRDWFAGQALAGIMTRLDLESMNDCESYWVAEQAYNMANDMLDVKENIEAEEKNTQNEH